MLVALNLVRPVIDADALVLASVICALGAGVTASRLTTSSAQDVKQRDRSKEKKIFRIVFFTGWLRVFTLIFRIN